MFVLLVLKYISKANRMNVIKYYDVYIISFKMTIYQYNYVIRIHIQRQLLKIILLVSLIDYSISTEISMIVLVSDLLSFNF